MEGSGSLAAWTLDTPTTGATKLQAPTEDAHTPQRAGICRDSKTRVRVQSWTGRLPLCQTRTDASRKTVF